jgi:hypothetical protein
MVAACTSDERWRNAPGEALTTTGKRACDAYFAELTRQKLACKADAARIAVELAGPKLLAVELPDDAADATCAQFSADLAANPITCAPPEPE